MLQQVNLLEHLPKQKHILFSLKQILLLCLFFFLLLTSLSGIVKWQLWQHGTDLDKEKQKQVYLTDQLLKMGFEIPSLNNGKELSDALVALQKRLSKRAKVHDHFNQALGYNVQGFSSYFVDFAMSAFPGIWLNHIEISGERDHVVLQGAAVETSLINRYISQLQTSDHFVNKPFKYMKISKTEKHVTFKAGTNVQDVVPDDDNAGDKSRGQ